MVSRRDQYRAYRFVARRNAGALLGDDSGGSQSPVRRLSTGVTGSVVVALVVVAAFGLLGLFLPSGSTATWKNGTSLIVEKETGTRYVYLDGALHPVANYASALLILHGSASVVDVSESSLAAAPRGAPVGISGAPDSVPTTNTLLGSPWTVCSLPATDQTGQPHPLVRVGAGRSPAGRPLPAGTGLLISARTGGEFLVVNGARLRLSAEAAAALGYAAAAPLPVADAWADAVPQGPDLAALTVPGVGGAGPTVGGRPTRVGQLFQAGDDAYVMFADGLAPISSLQLKLLLASPELSPAYPGATVQPITLTTGQLAQVHTSTNTPATTAQLPAQPPTLVDTGSSPVQACVVVSDATTAPTITTAPAAAQVVTGGAAATVDALGAPVADGFDLAPGHGAVVRALPAPGVTTGTVYLVTDLGDKFPVTATATLNDLGLKGVTPTPLPVGVLQLFPTGPTLDEQAAASTVPLTQASPPPSPSA